MECSAKDFAKMNGSSAGVIKKKLPLNFLTPKNQK